MKRFTSKEKWIALTIAIAAIAAHFIHLGMMPLMADEAIRATVAWEMMVDENYLVPTLRGEFYYRKPPLYNWIVIGFFRVFDSYSEFVFRLPSVLPLILLAFVTWFFSRKTIGDRGAAIAAFGFLLSGRLLTRDSMLGHIDLAFSLVTFVGFFTIYYFHNRKNYWVLFAVSYFLAAVGVLMKGLPSFLFQGLTLIAWFVYSKEWKRLFSGAHFAGILLFSGIVGGYFAAYSHFNSLEVYFSELYGQAAMRTVVDKPWYDGLVNIFTFPFENFGHLFPTSLILLFALRKGTIGRWRQSKFLTFVLVTLLINLLPYWLSPGYYPRYLFMLYPLCFILGAESYVHHSFQRTRLHRWVEVLFLAIGIAQGLALIAVFFVDGLEEVEYKRPIASLLIIATSFVVWLWFKQSQWRIYWFFAFLVLFRTGFDAFVIPYRLNADGASPPYRKEMAMNVLAQMDYAKPIKVYDNSPIYLEHAFYLGVATGKVIERTTELNPSNYYLMDQYRLKRLKGFKSVYSYEMFYKDYVIHLCEYDTASD